MADFNYSEYLSNLLIIQYAHKNNAVETIKSLGKMFPVDLIVKVRDAFDLDTAKGVALDLLGKYIGVTRGYVNGDDEVSLLDDEEFRTLIKFKAIANASNASHYDIDMALYNFFGNKVRATSSGNMEMTIFIPVDAQNVILAAIQQKALPRPLGVNINRIVVQSADFFGFVNYQNQYSIYKTGFREYNNPSKSGETLNYDKTQDVET